MKPCPHCGGTGHVRSESSVALLVVRAIEEFLLKDFAQPHHGQDAGVDGALRAQPQAQHAGRARGAVRPDDHRRSGRFGRCAALRDPARRHRRKAAGCRRRPCPRPPTSSPRMRTTRSSRPRSRGSGRTAVRAAATPSRGAAARGGEDGQRDRKRRRRRRRRGGRDRDDGAPREGALRRSPMAHEANADDETVGDQDEPTTKARTKRLPRTRQSNRPRTARPRSGGAASAAASATARTAPTPKSGRPAEAGEALVRADEASRDDRRGRRSPRRGNRGGEGRREGPSRPHCREAEEAGRRSQADEGSRRTRPWRIARGSQTEDGSGSSRVGAEAEPRRRASEAMKRQMPALAPQARSADAGQAGSSRSSPRPCPEDS